MIHHERSQLTTLNDSDGKCINGSLKKMLPKSKIRKSNIVHGGIIADDTGMGKTVTVLALIAACLSSCRARTQSSLEKWKSAPQSPRETHDKNRHDLSPESLATEIDKLSFRLSPKPCSAAPPHVCRPITLIVVPLSVLAQWRNEIKSRTGLAVYVHHGLRKLRSSTLESRLRSVDIVLTTYTLLSKKECSEVPMDEMLNCACSCHRNSMWTQTFSPGLKCNQFSKCKLTENGWTNATSNNKHMCGAASQRSCLHRVFWERIVLDEAHLITNASTNRSQAANSLQCQGGRWCLTATPIQNRGFQVFVASYFSHFSHFSNL